MEIEAPAISMVVTKLLTFMSCTIMPYSFCVATHLHKEVIKRCRDRHTCQRTNPSGLWKHSPISYTNRAPSSAHFGKASCSCTNARQTQKRPTGILSCWSFSLIIQFQAQKWHCHTKMLSRRRHCRCCNNPEATC